MVRSLRFWFLILGTALALALPGPTAAQPADQPAVQAVLFYSPTCSHCHYVITDVLIPMQEQFGEQLQLVGIDVTQPAGNQLYQAAIGRFHIPEARRGVPTLVVGEEVLVGSAEIPEQFPTLVEAMLAEGGAPWPDIPGLAPFISEAIEAEPAPPVPQPPATPVVTATARAPAKAAVPARAGERASPVYLAYFFDPTCLECARVSAELEALQAEFDHLVVRRYNLHQEAALNEAMCEKFGVSPAQRLMAPAIFIGQDCLTAGEITADRLQEIIERPSTAQVPPPWEGLEMTEPEATGRIVERFKQFGLLAVAGAGLLDGVNPCAFTTIIFFVSYLALVGRKGREILLVGAAFTLAVFLTYLVMGLGLAEVVRQMSAFALMARFIYGATALICLALAGLSLWDYLKIRRGQLAEIALQLPDRLKKRIHHTIRSRSRTRNFVTAAFGAGVLVSVFELACTGQVYLPTIVFVTGVAELRLTAIAYLILYNVMFVVPLVAVFLVTYYGTSSRQIAARFQAKAGLVKLGTALLFGVLGLWLGFMVTIS